MVQKSLCSLASVHFEIYSVSISPIFINVHSLKNSMQIDIILLVALVVGGQSQKSSFGLKMLIGEKVIDENC